MADLNGIDQIENTEFNFRLTVHSLTLALRNPAKINVIWKTGNHRTKLREFPMLEPSIGKVNINQALESTHKFIKNSEEQTFNSSVTIQATFQGRGTKTVGKLQLDLSDYTSKDLIRSSFPLIYCPDQNSEILISLQTISEGEQPPTHLGGLPTDPLYYEQSNSTNKLAFQNNSLKAEKQAICANFELFREKARKDRESLFSHMTQVQAESIKLKQRLRRKSERLLKRKDTIKQLQSVNARLLQDINNLEKRNNPEQLDTRVKQFIEQNSRLEKELADARFTLKQQTKLIDILQKKSSNTTGTIGDLESTVDQLRIQMRQAMDGPDAFIAYNGNSDQIMSLKHQLEEARANHCKEMDFLKKQIQELETELKNTKIQAYKEVADLKEQVAELKADRPMEQSIYTSAQEDLKIANLQILNLKNRLSDAHQQHKAQEKKHIESKMGWANCDIERVETESKHKESLRIVQHYKSECERMEQELNRLNERFGQMLDSNNELEMELRGIRYSCKF